MIDDYPTEVFASALMKIWRVERLCSRDNAVSQESLRGDASCFAISACWG